MTQEQIQSLDTAALRSLLRSTKPTSERFAHEIVWAKDEMARRYRQHNNRLYQQNRIGQFAYGENRPSARSCCS